jgi:uncharacterized protein
MLLTQDHSDAQYQITSFSPGKIGINDKTYTSSVIISLNQLIDNWRPRNVDMITDDDLLLLLALKPDIILLGTGEKSIMLPAKKLACLLEKNFYVECMNTAAACRTYTVLAAEGRNVVAGLLL